MEDLHYSKSWDDAYLEGMTMWYPSECIVRFMAKNFRKQIGFDHYKTIREASRVLDIGCGNGANVLYFKKMGYEAVGCDISKVAVDMGNSMLAENGFDECLIHGDMEDLNFDTNSFDIIVSHAALDHIMFRKYIAVIEKIKCVLVKEGFLYISLRGMEGFEYEKKTATEIEQHTLITGQNKELNSPFENPHEKDIPQHFFTLDEIKESLRDFEIINVEKTVEYGGKNLGFVDSRWFITAKLI